MRVRGIGQAWASCIMISLCCCTAHCLQQQCLFTQPEHKSLTHTLSLMCHVFGFLSGHMKTWHINDSKHTRVAYSEGYFKICILKTILSLMLKVFNAAKQLFFKLSVKNTPLMTWDVFDFSPICRGSFTALTL